MPLSAGTRLGHYEILAPLGQGGMGEVYRARDGKLHRDVALKVLPDALARDQERLARFRREALALASLNHPHIAGIYGLEDTTDTTALVLELVAGDTLSDLIIKGLSMTDALAIARQIAEALEAAHGAGIIHRDLKPDNVKVTPDGVVKVLDFGLAKQLAPAASGAPPATIVAETKLGSVMGTTGYMSPEQARGGAVDQRTDIWSFGCILYEMLTGQAPFGHESDADTLARVLTSEPDWQALPTDTPPPVRTLIRRCLQKDRHDRLPHIGAARLELADALGTSRTGTVTSVAPPAPRRWATYRIGLGATLLFVAVALGWIALSDRGDSPRAPPAAVSRVSIEPPAGESWVISPHDPDLAISPDGQRIAYIGRRGERNELMVRGLNEFGSVSLGSFGGAVRHPLFSPDSEWVAFVDGNVLKKIRVSGGQAVNVCVLPGYMSGATWGPDNVITFGTLNMGLFRVPSSGGEPTTFPTSTQGNGRNSRWPEALPNGTAILFAAISGGGQAEIRMRSLVTDEERVVVRDATFPRYASTGHLLYVAGGALWGARFDPRSVETVGDAEPVVDGIMVKGPPQTGLGAANVAISATGTLIYRPSGTGATDASTLVWVDREGREEAWPLEPRAYGRMQLSPNGAKIAIEVTDEAAHNTDIWVGDAGGTTLSQLTFDPGLDEFPVWTRDGTRVLFKSSRAGGGLYAKRADGTGPAELLSNAQRVGQVYFVTPDGTQVVYLGRTDDGSPPALGYFGLRLDRTHINRSLPLVPGPVAAISGDGRWMAYSSEETGNFEVYVQPFPNPDAVRWRITTGGGRDPVWSADGRELYFQNDTTMFAARLTANETFAVAPAVALFDGPYVDSNGRWYDVAPDGRFVMIKPGWLSADPDAPLYIVLNWTEELQQRLP
jgi:hypothetical protein